MGKVTGFLEVDRRDRDYIPTSKRTLNFEEFLIPLSDEALREQASRCMDCGIPFCHDMKGIQPIIFLSLLDVFALHRVRLLVP